MDVSMTGDQKKVTLQFEKLKARVDKIHIDGLQRTKDDFVTNSFKEIFKIRTFEELLEKTIEARLKLEKLGCFKNISIVIDTSSGTNSTSNFDYDVTFKVVELNRITGRINTTIENNQGSLGFAIQTPNLIGRGENLQSEIKYNLKKTQTFNTSFVKPLKFYDGTFNALVFKQNTENIASGYKLTEYGIQCGMSFLYGEKINHNVEYEGIVRNVGLLNRNVAFPIREHCGYSLKSSIKNTLSADSRDSTVFPTVGSIIQLKSEFAGLGGDTGFLKNEIFSQINIPLISGISFQGSFGVGVITETTKEKFYSLIDRFFIGGPLTLRGFHFQSVGPKVDGFATGGSLYCLGALHLYTPLPHRPSKGSFGNSFKMHFFCNFGNLGDVSSNLKDCFRSLSNNMRLTYGIGLVYRLGQMARVELNYCIPLYYQTDDKLIDGVQLGLGVQFV
ncbi:hypothetical protein PGB90_006669 [Kerria lacca]